MRPTAKFMPILHDDWSMRLGEYTPDQSSQPFKHLATMPPYVVSAVMVMISFL